MKIVIIGGGAAGMMAAGTAARAGHEVTVIEHSRKTLLKLGITGKGRCNLTNDCDVKTLVANTPHGGKFLYGAFSRFTPADTMAMFEGLGVPLKTERGGRVFPVSDRAFDIVDALRRYANGARVVFANAEHILTENGAVTGVKTDGGIIAAERVILATGGASYAATGSDGTGYELARELGHTVFSPEPSLVPLNAARSLCAPLSGLTLKNVEFMLYRGGKMLYNELGELLFTHTGVSGPTALSASVHMRGAGEYSAAIDLKPALDMATLDARILREIEAAPNINFSSLVPKFLPKSMTRAICEKSGLAPGLKLNIMTRENRAAFAATLKRFELGTVTKRGFDEAIVTAGGVDTREIDPRSMRSKLVAGLSFAGEIIDVDGYTGGYNLQIAWATGRAAGRAVGAAIEN
jgi:predicted Rossmann fold flavoprotein